MSSLREPLPVMLVKSLLIVAIPLALLACSDAAEPSAQGGAAGSAGSPAAGAHSAGTASSSAGSASASGGTAGSFGGANGGSGGASGGSGGDGAAGGDDEYISKDALIAPAGLNLTAHPGGCGILKLSAFTLDVDNHVAYAALENHGDTPACSPGFSIQVFDADEQPLATGLAGLLLRRFYRLKDGSGTRAACVGPGDVTMVAVTELPSELALSDIGRVEFWCTFWSLEVEPLGQLDVTDVRTVSREGGVAYAGSLANGLDVAVSAPAVAVFPLANGGRPFGIARAMGTSELAPGATWEFETNPVADAGVDYAAYPAGGP